MLAAIRVELAMLQFVLVSAGCSPKLRCFEIIEGVATSYEFRSTKMVPEIGNSCSLVAQFDKVYSTTHRYNYI